MRCDARRIPAFFDSRLNCAAGAAARFEGLNESAVPERENHQRRGDGHAATNARTKSKTVDPKGESTGAEFGCASHETSLKMYANMPVTLRSGRKIARLFDTFRVLSRNRASPRSGFGLAGDLGAGSGCRPNPDSQGDPIFWPTPP